MDIHLNHQACLLAQVLSDKEERVPGGDAFMRLYYKYRRGKGMMFGKLQDLRQKDLGVVEMLYSVSNQQITNGIPYEKFMTLL